MYTHNQCIYLSISLYIHLYIYIYIYGYDIIVMIIMFITLGGLGPFDRPLFPRHLRLFAHGGGEDEGPADTAMLHTASPPTKSLDFGGFDSSKLLIPSGGNSHVR